MPATPTAILTLMLTGGAALAASPPPDLTGTWVMESARVEVAPVPMVGEVTTTAKTLSVLQIAQEGGALEVTETLCALRFDSSAPKSVSTAVLPSLAPHLEPLERQARLVEHKGRWELRADKQWEIVGARLAKPDDPLPTERRDPRVVDADRDGKPGFSVEIGGIVRGTIHVVQRGWTTLRGALDKTGELVGLVDWGQEQVYLGATNPFLRSPLRSRKHPDATKHRFRARRAGESAPAPTCTDVLKAPAKYL